MGGKSVRTISAPYLGSRSDGRLRNEPCILLSFQDFNGRGFFSFAAFWVTKQSDEVAFGLIVQMFFHAFYSHELWMTVDSEVTLQKVWVFSCLYPPKSINTESYLSFIKGMMPRGVSVRNVTQTSPVSSSHSTTHASAGWGRAATGASLADPHHLYVFPQDLVLPVLVTFMELIPEDLFDKYEMKKVA